MKNNIVTSIILVLTMATFSSSALAQSSSEATSSAENAAESSNNGSNVTVTFEAEEDTRGVDSPIQTNSTNDVHYSGEYDVNTVPDVSAPGLTTTLTETCMGSTSAGGAVVGFGFSFGTTWRDTACVRRLDSRQLHDLGYSLGAKELMCDSDTVRAALLRAGKPCFADLPEGVREEINPSANATVKNQEANLAAIAAAEVARNQGK